MKIGVDIRVLMDKHYSGVSEYTANLLTAILRQNAALNKPDDYRLFYNSFHNLNARLNKWNGARSRVVATRWPNKIFNYFLQKVFSWPKIDKVLGGTDIFWSPHFNFTRLSKGAKAPKKIITVHDLSFLRYPEFFSARKNFWHRALGVKKILREADAIIAVSENTKNDIIELASVAPEKIIVIYSGNDLVKREVSDEEKREFLLKHGLTDDNTTHSARFILYLGNIEPRKNISGLITAFNELRAKDASDRRKFLNLKLVLAGASGWKNRKIYMAWQNLPYKNDIKFLGYISQKEKEILYKIATVFVYPSFYEGFGFPPLEAMTLGLPVICSNVSSLPEVVGDAALAINPFKSEEIKDALEIILTNEKIRERLITKGYERAKLFFWDKAMSEYLKLFNSLSS